MTPLEYEIALVGLGVNGVHQLTREAEDALRRSAHVFMTDMATGVIKQVRAMGVDATNLYSKYVPGKHRIEIYREMASIVVSAALEQPPVTFATYGHPKFYCYPSALIQRAARLLDLRVAVLPGVSSLDTLMVDLELDPAMDGLQVYEATDLIVRNRPIQPDATCVILQAAIALDPYNNPGHPSTDGLELLQRHVLQFYPASHRGVLLVSATHPLLEPMRVSFALGDLATAVASASNVATLIIPPAQTRAVADQRLAERMQLRPDPDDVSRRPGRPHIGPADEGAP
jgi:precorrin-2 methylase